MKTRSVGIILVVAVALALLSGCKDGGPSSRIYVNSGQTGRLRVAVLPFDNVSRDPDAGRTITNTVITYLLSTGQYDVVEPGVVYATLNSEGVRLSEGVTVATCQKLQPKLNADIFVLGMVEEYGEVRVGSDTYPSISFSSRVVDARTADIIWAATISKTGADNVKIFDIGRVSSLGKLAKQAVAAMADSLSDSHKYISADIGRSAQPTPPPTTTTTTGAQPTGGTHGTEQPAVTTTGPTTSTTPTTSTSTQPAKYLDETALYGEKELTALLKDVGTMKVGPVTYKKHFHDSVLANYQLSDGKSIEVTLYDYLKVDSAKKMIQHYHPDEQQTTFETMPAFTSESDFGYYHLDMSVGRFGVMLRGPKDKKSDIEALGKGIIDLLK